MSTTTDEKTTTDSELMTGRVRKSDEEMTDDEFEWTAAKLEEEMFQYLATYTERLDNEGDIVEIKPYYQQALYLMPRIPIWIQERFGAAPPFEIKKSTLTLEIKKKISNFRKDSYEWVFKEVIVNAVGKLFENIDSRYYHRSVKGLLTVRFID